MKVSDDSCWLVQFLKKKPLLSVKLSRKPARMVKSISNTWTECRSVGITNLYHSIMIKIICAVQNNLSPDKKTKPFLE